MAKRFFDTKLFNEDWFLEMPIESKLFWFYILSDCDHAGIYRVNLRSFCGLNEVKLTSNEIIEHLNNGKQRIRVISSTVWLIEDFFFYQYGSIMNNSNRVHKSIYDIYKKYNIELNTIRGLIEVKYGVKDKDIDIVIDKSTSLVLNNKKEEILKKEEKEPIYVELKKIYELSSYEIQSDSIKDKYSKNEFDSYLKFIKLFKRYESKIKYNEFPLLDEFVNDLFLKFKWNQIEEGITTMFGNGFKTDMHLVSRLITCIGWQKQPNGVQAPVAQKEPKQEVEWWRGKYGDRFKTIEEFNEAYNKRIIDPFND